MGGGVARTLARGVVKAQGRDGQRPEFWTQDAGPHRWGTGGGCRDATVARAKRRLLCAGLDRLRRGFAAPHTWELLRRQACVNVRTRYRLCKTHSTVSTDLTDSY